MGEVNVKAALASPTPRMKRDGVLGLEKFCSTYRPGTRYLTSSRPKAGWFCRSSALNALIATGTACRFCETFCAVTTICSRPCAGGGALCGVSLAAAWAAASPGTAQAAATASVFRTARWTQSNFDIADPPGNISGSAGRTLCKLIAICKYLRAVVAGVSGSAAEHYLRSANNMVNNPRRHRPS